MGPGALLHEAVNPWHCQTGLVTIVLDAVKTYFLLQRIAALKAFLLWMKLPPSKLGCKFMLN